MLPANFKNQLTETLDSIDAQGLYKRERLISGPQSVEISVVSGEAACQARSDFIAGAKFLCQQLPWFGR